MEFMVAYYPMLKVGVATLFLTLIWFLGVKKKNIKTVIVLCAAAVVFYAMIPVHIDGTNQSKALLHELQYQDSKYTYQSDEIQQHHKTVLSFDEQMALIDKKNEAKNKQVQKDIKK